MLRASIPVILALSILSWAVVVVGALWVAQLLKTL